MRNIEKFDRIIEKAEGGENVEYNNTLMWAYRDSLQSGNEIIDFHETIWSYDIEPIVTELREAGETHFSISGCSSILLEDLADFTERGCVIEGVTKAKMKYSTMNFETMKSEQAVEKALLIRL